MQDPQSLHKYAYVHGDPVQGVDPTGWSFTDSFSLQGIAAHVAFTLWAKMVRPHTRPGIQISTLFSTLSLDSLLKPDLVDDRTREFFDLKPVRHKNPNNRAMQIADHNEMENYAAILAGEGFSRGDSYTLVPYVIGGLLIGEITVGTTTWQLKLWPADDPMQPSGKSGRGLVWYKVDSRTKPLPPVTFPVTEAVRQYEGEPEKIRIRVWEPYFAPIAELEYEKAALVGAYTAGVVAMAYVVNSIATMNSMLGRGAF